MRLRLQFGRWLMVLGIGAGMALQCAAQDPRANRTQSRQENKPPKQQRQQQNQQRRREPRQGRPQPRPDARRGQPERRYGDAPRNPATGYAPRGYGDSRGGGNRP